MSDERGLSLANCPFCGGEAKLRRLVEAYPAEGEHPAGEYDAWFYVNCDDCGVEVGDEYQSGAVEAWNRRAALPEQTSEEDRMGKISGVIADLQDVLDRFGDTCVYIRRGGMAWGAVALNRKADDEKNGVFDLQVTHDRDMSERLAQVDRLVADRNEWRDRAWKAETALSPSTQHVEAEPVNETLETEHADSDVEGKREKSNYPEIPDGWVLVPREPTEAMIDAARHFLEPSTERIGRAAYRAMLSSAPSAPLNEPWGYSERDELLMRIDQQVRAAIMRSGSISPADLAFTISGIFDTALATAPKDNSNG